jgi:hypothetical protein
MQLGMVLLAVPGAAENTAISMDGGIFRVTGWQAGVPPAAGWSAVLAVYAGTGDVPPMLGSYQAESGTLSFKPRFPLPGGMHVRAVFHAPGEAAVEAAFDIPKGHAPAASTRVAHVYPSTNLLPANQLKLYLCFSAPMPKGDAWRHIHLLREDGRQVPAPFLEIDQELWDRDHLRLTVLFDPGRIKRGLASLAEAGPALEAGKRYALVVDRDWLDSRGAPLAEEFRKEFRVAPADRVPPEVTAWRVTAPRAGTTDPLVLHFPKPMDYALLQHLLEVKGMRGMIEGNIALEREETEWRFTPRQAWKAGRYRVVVQTTLEDLAGNHIGRAFDVDTFERVTPVARETAEVGFRVR